MADPVSSSDLIAGAFAVIVTIFGGAAWLVSRIDRVERSLRQEIADASRILHERIGRAGEEQNRLRHDNTTRVMVLIDDVEERVTDRIKILEAARRLGADD